MNEVLLTLDVDWAPDFVIDWVAEQLINYQIRATWFVTHLSPAIKRLQKYSEIFELGIHPNFLPGSTQGNTDEAILHHCMTLIPEAISIRTHGLVQSTPLLATVINQTGITTDVSLFLPHIPFLRPIEYWWSGRKLMRIPYYWEDDFEMECPNPCWHLEPLLAIGEGLKVFDFHPIHIYLNSPNLKPYQALKQIVPNLSEAKLTEIAPFIHQGEGTQTLFREIIEYLSASHQSLCIRDIQLLEPRSMI